MSDSPRLQAIDKSLFDRVAAVARRKPRLRMNHNLHQESDLVQRFLNVLQPGTYVRPHRHVREHAGTGFECFLVLQGAIGLLIFDGDGQLMIDHLPNANVARIVGVLWDDSAAPSDCYSDTVKLR